MVNSKARSQAAKLIKKYKNGIITNDQLRDSWPQEKKPQDHALKAIYTALWYTYSDLRSHKAEMSPELKEFYERCYLFLESDLEYRWKTVNFIGIRSFMRFLTLGVSSFFEKAPVDPNTSQMMGSNAIWPFYTEAELAQQRNKHTSKN